MRPKQQSGKPKGKSALASLFAVSEAGRPRVHGGVPPAAWYAEAGRRARRRREGSGLSQGDVARHLGVSRVLLSYWEGGLRVPTAQDVARLAVVLDVSLDWLLLGVEYAERQDVDLDELRAA